MREHIAKTDYYSIAVDSAKNRVYLMLIGFWKNPTVVPCFLDDMKKALRDVSTGFTVLTDASQMKTPPLEIAPLHEKAQQLFIQRGMRKTAELVSAEMALEKMALRQWSTKSGMMKRSFHDQVEAEAWLDER